MTAVTEATRERAGAISQRWSDARRRGVPLETRVLGGLVVAVAAITALVAAFPTVMPFTSLMVPLLVGSLFLGPRHLVRFVVLVLVALAVSISQQVEVTPRVAGALGIQVLMCLIVLATSTRRSRLGVNRVLGESMFVDLRDRILDQGGILDLPAGWRAESALTSAGGTAFAGDFFLSARPDRDRLELVVVDVSGKGEQAGTRALLLSGAFGGLLGALAPGEFLPAANAYLMRQDWEEGFATAVHLSVDLSDGSYELRCAGHPPAAYRNAGTGRWSVLDAVGPVLGLIDDADFTCARGVLRAGDAMLLYTDGMVEEPRVDIDLGIDRMLGEAESLLRGDFSSAARRLVDTLGSLDDDRAVLVITRS